MARGIHWRGCPWFCVVRILVIDLSPAGGMSPCLHGGVPLYPERLIAPWWFYLFWLPAFLQRKHGLSLQQIFFPIMVVYLISDAGSVAGGWISSSLIRRGKSINAARKPALLICAICVLPAVLVPHMESMWNAVLPIGPAAAAHQGFSANLYTLTSDMVPSPAIGSVVGMGGMLGALGGLLIASLVGHVLQRTGSYQIPFFVAGVAYFRALGVIQLLAPRLEPARLVVK
jgi:MFS transporter, ACS family, hexuronate transporter